MWLWAPAHLTTDKDSAALAWARPSTEEVCDDKSERPSYKTMIQLATYCNHHCFITIDCLTLNIYFT
jgi:hypothetical protein